MEKSEKGYVAVGYGSDRCYYPDFWYVHKSEDEIGDLNKCPQVASDSNGGIERWAEVFETAEEAKEANFDCDFYNGFGEECYAVIPLEEANKISEKLYSGRH